MEAGITDFGGGAIPRGADVLAPGEAVREDCLPPECLAERHLEASCEFEAPLNITLSVGISCPPGAARRGRPFPDLQRLGAASFPHRIGARGQGGGVGAGNPGLGLLPGGTHLGLSAPLDPLLGVGSRGVPWWA